ncbi:MAG: hypothetical protein JNL87_08570 [Burkholderiaceae bacterium]|nr:hypothetical protein [Burkholderiaceae bacterium]
MAEPARRRIQDAITRVLGAGARWCARLTVLVGELKETFCMADDLNAASEALVAMPLPTMLKSLGLAVAEANKAMSENKGPNNTVMTVTDATIKLKIAISVNKTEDLKVGGGMALQAFNVNASYARTFGFKEDASSEITMTLAVRTA